MITALLVFSAAPAAWSQTILKNKGTSSAKKKDAEQPVMDYSDRYPKSTPEEYKKAADLMRTTCVGFRETAARIKPAAPGEKEENFEKTCECYQRNIAKAKDIHEVLVMTSYFRRVEMPPSVFADDPEIGDVFDERPDYVAHATNVIESCRLNPAHVEPFSTPEPTPAPSIPKKKSAPAKPTAPST